jgi:hypothetical protein
MSGQQTCQRLGRIVSMAILLAGFSLPAAGQQNAPAPVATPSQPPATQLAETVASTPAEESTPTSQPSESPATQPAEPEHRRGPKDILHLDYLDGDLEMESQYDWRRVKAPVRNPYSPPARQTQTDKLWHISENLGFQAAGDIVDPQWFTYNMALRLGMDQDIARENSSFERLGYSHNGWLSQYNINLGVLPGKPIHWDVYTSREDGRLNRLFLPSLWHESWRTGFTTFFENDRFPMELTFEQTRDAYSGNIDRLDDEDVKDTLLRYGGTVQFTPYHKLRLDYQRDERHERYFGSPTRFNTTQNVLRLDDQLQFGGQHQHLWENNVEYEEDTGDLPLNHLYLGSRVALQHSKELTTEYKYEFSRDSFGGTTLSTDRLSKSQEVTLDTNRFDWIGTWRPTKDLTTTGDLFAGHDQSDEGLSSNLFGGLMRVTGNRENRYGMLSGTAGYQYDYVDTSFGDRSGTQVNETLTFRNTTPMFLAHANVVLDSVLVTDLKRSQIFTLGKDYLLIGSGKYTALIRQPFGRITENQPVRVYYRYRTIRSGRFQTHQFDAHLQQDFRSGWTPYYEVVLRRQSIDTSDTFFIEPNNVDRHRLGLTYHRKTWLVGGEAEFDDETVDPYNALHFNSNWTILERLADRLAVRSEVSQFWYRDLEQRKPTVFDFGLDYRHSLTSRAEANAAFLYRHEHDSVLGTTNGVDVRTGLAYKIGQLTLTADVEYDMLNIADSDEDGVSLWIKVRRDFPNLLGKRP